PQYTQYVQNNYLINPAVAGIESYADVRTGYRSQWLGIDGAPVSFYASIQGALNKHDKNAPSLRLKKGGGITKKTTANKNNRFYVKPHHGVGAIAQVDKAGLLRASSLNISYAYHLPIAKSTILSAGLSTGIMQYHIDRDRLVVQTPDDPLMYGDMLNQLHMDLGIGMWLYSKDFYVGVSGTQLIKSSHKYHYPDKDPRAGMQPHYYFTAGYRANLSNAVSMTPSFMIKTAEGGLTAVDANLKASYEQRFWTGITYRHQDAIAAMAGIYVNHLIDISYSQDITTSPLKRVSANTHEVVLGIKLNNPSRIICPRWLW
ncbi:hypothetical protein OB13_16525, partial [Pontibacter sp. HJ8]